MILDVDSVYGSPYGGFSRATASRLAGIPLKLPHTGEELVDYVSDYTTIRDNQGRPFACKVYHEDELDPMSLNESMFNSPVLKPKKEDEKEKMKDALDQKATENEGERTDRGVATSGEDESLKESQRNGNTQDIGESKPDENPADRAAEAAGEQQKSTSASSSETTSGASSSSTVDVSSNLMRKMDGKVEVPRHRDLVVMARDLNNALDQLIGMCAQIHMGWWSYSWCHQTDIKQFHVVVQKGEGNVQNIELEDITVLGKFVDRRLTFPSPEDDNDEPVAGRGRKKLSPKDLAGDLTPLGVVSETYVDGDICPETYQPRETHVTIRCCSPKVMSRAKGGVLQDGRPIVTDLVSVLDLTESRSPPCVYSMTICTPLLCEDPDKDSDGQDASASSRPSLLPSSMQKKRPSPITPSSTKNTLDASDGNMDPAEVEKMTVVEVLHAMFGTKGVVCLIYGTGGWWLYEFCPGGTIRQYHEMTVIERATGSAANVVDTEHYLGRYIKTDHEKGVTKENEWRNMVNATNTVIGSSGSSSGSSRGNSGLGLGGNGAYYFQEYTNGDACINEDVEESSAYGTKRATTVRYYCGSTLQMTVKEDSTCHYVVDITVPALCGHPLFKAPVSKKQVMKCVPLPLSYANDLI